MVFVVSWCELCVWDIVCVWIEIFLFIDYFYYIIRRNIGWVDDGVLDKFCKIWVNMVFKYLCGIFLYIEIYCIVINYCVFVLKLIS